uniref:Si:ch211-284k5.2 n=1 Tax=Cyclopterus lumpus TaxID=8103 RepID=A0A8C2Z0R5_CYCLU
MHRSYQPLKPVTNRYLQQRWDHQEYENHRRKVSSTLPVVDIKGMRTPAHVQLKLKKLQLQDERLSIIDRDNRLLASKLTDIVCSKGLVDHWNQYHLRSLNADKRREELLLVDRQNEAIYQRITCRQSEHRRQLWLEDWERTRRRRDDISRYPRGLAEKQAVKFAVLEGSERSESFSSTERTGRDS